MSRSGERLLFGRTLEDDDLLVFCSIREWSRKPVKDVTREILVVGNQAWLEQSSLGDGVLEEIRLKRSQGIIHIEAILLREQHIRRETGQHL